jgi:opacity protein-like surface antigen
MRGVTRAFALLGGLAASGLLSPTTKAADLEPVSDPGLQWYGSLFGGPKWGNADVKLEWERENDPCYGSSLLCALQPLIRHEGKLRGEVDDGFIFGGTLGAQFYKHFRGEVELSAARLDIESEAFEYVAYAPGVGSAYTAKDDDHLRELFVFANAWFDFQLTSMICTYIGGGAGVAHVDADFGVDPFVTGGGATPPPTFSASLEADDWAFAYQLGAGVLVGLSQHIAIDLGYRFKAIPNVELDDPEFCGEHCYPPVADTDADNDFDIHEHVAHIGIIYAF